MLIYYIFEYCGLFMNWIFNWCQWPCHWIIHVQCFLLFYIISINENLRGFFRVGNFWGCNFLGAVLTENIWILSFLFYFLVFLFFPIFVFIFLLSLSLTHDLFPLTLSISLAFFWFHSLLPSFSCYLSNTLMFSHTILFSYSHTLTVFLSFSLIFLVFPIFYH